MPRMVLLQQEQQEAEVVGQSLALGVLDGSTLQWDRVADGFGKSRLQPPLELCCWHWLWQYFRAVPSPSLVLFGRI